MALDDRLRDRQAQADAGDRRLLGRLGAVEALEQTALVGLGDAQAGVGHLDHHAVAAVDHAHVDAAAGGRELERVRDQVVERLPQPARVALDGGDRLGVQAQLDAELVGARARGLDRLGGDVVERGGTGLERQLARLELGDEQQVADQALEALGVALDDVQEVALVGGRARTRRGRAPAPGSPRSRSAACAARARPARRTPPSGARRGAAG